MVPSARLLGVSILWLLLAGFPVAWPHLYPHWLVLGGLFGLVAVADLVAVRFFKPLIVQRRLPGRFACGEAGDVCLRISNPGRFAARIEVFDGIPEGALSTVLPWRGDAPAGREIKVYHPLILRERGEARFGDVHIRRLSPRGLWWRATRHPAEETVRVYPNYEPVIRFALLAMSQRESSMGLTRKPRSGSSRDFRSLRDYRDGDPLSQIDWKATSRRQALISRDYQEQRDQSVVFLVDTGRRMRALDDGVPQFDHVLNTILLVAHIALKQGDHVAVQSFGGSDRWLPPVKGSHAMPVLLNHLYDYQTTPAPSDFSSAVERLMSRQRRRSLVILLTNLRGEDGNELLPAMQVLNSRHLVLLASMREGAVQQAFTRPVESFSAALTYLAADRYVQERREVLAGLGAAGILTLDSTARDFPIALANRYVDIKSAGRL